MDFLRGPGDGLIRVEEGDEVLSESAFERPLGEPDLDRDVGASFGDAGGLEIERAEVERLDWGMLNSEFRMLNLDFFGTAKIAKRAEIFSNRDRGGSRGFSDSAFPLPDSTFDKALEFMRGLGDGARRWIVALLGFGQIF